MATKKVKGSAVYLEDGGLIFTPYNQNPQNSPWKRIMAVSNGKIKCTDEIVQVTLTCPRTKNANKLLMQAFANLMVHLTDYIND